MPPPASAEEFLDLVHKSGVAEETRTKPYVQKLRDAATLPHEAGKVAGLMVRDGLITHFQAEQLLQGKWKRFSIGKYKVLEKIGSGGMGQVFLCEHKLMRRRVAVKVLPTAKAADPSSLDRFYREAKAIAALDHPNIVRAYDIDQDENLHFLVMEFVDGTNFQDLVKRHGPLDVLRACHYAYASAVGLQYAFEQGIVHRDIKPANILIDRAGVVKILDMGLARFFNDEDDQLTKKYDENVLGTADYLAPEQAVDSHTVTIQADIYSLGGTFYYMLTGQSPFPDGTVAQKLLWHQTREPKRVEDLRPEVPADLADVVRKMLAKDPLARYATPAELQAALAPWVQTPIPPPPDREMPQLSPAAVGVGGGGLAGRTAVSVSPSPGSLIGGANPVTLSSTAAMAVSPLVAAAVIAPPSDEVDSGAAVWGALAETQATAGTETGSAARPAPASARRGRAPAKPRPKWLKPAAFAALGVAVLAAGGFAAKSVLFPADTATGPSKGPDAAGKKLYVGKAATGANDRNFATLALAYQKAAAGDTILIADDLITDPPLKIDGTRSRLKDLTIAAADPGKPVRWAPPAPSGRVIAALEVIGVEGFKLRGVHLDVAGHYDVGIAFAGLMPGAGLEDCTVKGAREDGVRLAQVAGDAGRTVTVTRVGVSSDAPFTNGIAVAGTERVPSRGIQIDSCRIDGPCKTGVRTDGGATDVEVRGCRVFKADVGFLFAGGSGTVPMKVRVAQNTVAEAVVAAFKLDGTYNEKLPHEFAVGQNLIWKAKAAGAAKDGKWPGLKADANARDKATPAGALDVAVDAGDFKLGVDPANDAEFLKPEKPVAVKGQNAGAR